MKEKDVVTACTDMYKRRVITSTTDFILPAFAQLSQEYFPLLAQELLLYSSSHMTHGAISDKLSRARCGY